MKGNMDTPVVPPLHEVVSKEEMDRFLESIQTGRLTPGEIDELARLDEQQQKYSRTPREI